MSLPAYKIPDKLVEVMRPHQIEGARFFAEQERALIAFQPGMGKTLTAIAAVEATKHYLRTRPTLVLAPKLAALVWEKEVAKWTPKRRVQIVDGPQYKRAVYWQEAHNGDVADYYVVTYDSMMRDLKKGYMNKFWSHVICDEIHRARNRKAKAFAAVKQLTGFGKYVFQLTGTPVYRGPQNLWSYFNLLYPKKFRSYWRWVNEFCQMNDTGFGWEIVGVKNTEKCRRVSARHMLYKGYKDVEGLVPERTRIPVQVTPTPTQRRFYKEMIEDGLCEVKDGPLIIGENTISKIIRVRQLFCTPRIWDPSLEDGAAVEALLGQLEVEPHCVVFVPFKRAIPFIREAIVKKLPELADKIVTISGDTDKKQFNAIVQKFTEERGIAICTIAVSQSFDLDSANIAHFLGFEWDVVANEQAEGRLIRASSQHKMVIAYYYIHSGTIDHAILSTLTNKTRAQNAIYLSEAELQELYKRSKAV